MRKNKIYLPPITNYSPQPTKKSRNYLKYIDQKFFLNTSVECPRKKESQLLNTRSFIGNLSVVTDLLKKIRHVLQMFRSHTTTLCLDDPQLNRIVNKSKTNIPSGYCNIYSLRYHNPIKMIRENKRHTRNKYTTKTTVLYP